MPRPDRTAERRRDLLPVLAEAFVELGYRRATTAALARRCGVQETILYRLWPGKKSMFLAAIGHVFERSKAIWTERLASTRGGSAAERLLAYESKHLGEFGLYRILFAGLGESDDPEIRATMRETYRRFQGFVRRRIEDHRGGRGRTGLPEADLAAWALVGVGTMASLARELDLIPAARRSRLLAQTGKMLLGRRS